MDFLKKLAGKINVTDRAKVAAQALVGGAVKDFKESFRVLDADLDIDATPDGLLIVKLDNVGAEAKVPYAGVIAAALHTGGIGVLEGNEIPQPPRLIETPAVS